MKKLLTMTLVFIVLCICGYAQENTTLNAPQIKFPESFKAGASIFASYSLAPVNDQLKERGIDSNPGTCEQKEKIKKMVDEFPVDSVTKVYYELYYNKIKSIEDGGVIICEFTSITALEKSLSLLQQQSNNIYLIVGRYLIKGWSDAMSSSKTEMHLKYIEAHYKKKLNAVVFYPMNSQKTVARFSIEK